VSEPAAEGGTTGRTAGEVRAADAGASGSAAVAVSAAADGGATGRTADAMGAMADGNSPGSAAGAVSAAADAGAGGSANVVELLAAAARRHPERLALLASDSRGGQQGITYGDLWQRVRLVAAGLRRAGLAPGERAIVMIPMSIDLYVALLALLQLGAVAVFVDPWIGWRQVAAFAAFASPAAYLGTPRGHLLRWLSPALRRVRLTVTTGRRWGRLPAGRTLAELAAAGAADDAIFAAVAGDPALITFTSGSSGEPKGANRTHGFLLAQHRALAAEFPVAPDDVDLTTFPVFALRNLASGITSVVPAFDVAHIDRVDGPALLAQMVRLGVTTCTASPPFFDRLAAAIAAPGGALGRPAGAASAAPESPGAAAGRTFAPPGTTTAAGERPGAAGATFKRPGAASAADEPPGAAGAARERPAACLPRLRRLLTGGAPVADEQLARWRRALPETEIVVVYGSTEAEPVAHLTAEERLALATAAAAPLPAPSGGAADASAAPESRAAAPPSSPAGGAVSVAVAPVAGAVPAAARSGDGATSAPPPGAAQPPSQAAAPAPAPVAAPPRAPAAGYCVGPPCAAVRARVIRIHQGPVALDADGWAAWEVPAGEVGELVVAGDHVCRDYFRNPGAVAENKIRDAEGVVWHRMGDTGRLDARGRFWLAGRVHSTIWRRGRAVHPQLVEQAAAQTLGRTVRSLAAVGLPDEALGERVVLVLEGEDDAPAGQGQAADLEGAMPPASRGAAGVAAAPEYLEIDEVVRSRQPLPRDPRHRSKIDYAELRRRLLAERGAAAPPRVRRGG
jgi:acyl-CoA synthetase (AMP-forming)/AMP-acid ligase II